MRFPDLALQQARLLSKLLQGYHSKQLMTGSGSYKNIYSRWGTWIYLSNLTGYAIATNWVPDGPVPNQGHCIQGQPPHVPAGGIDKGTNYYGTHSQCHHTLHPPTHGLSRAKFLNIYRVSQVLQNFPGGSVWILTLWVDGSGPVLQLATASFIPKIKDIMC